MDADFWAARVHNHRHLPSVQSAKLSNSGNYSLVEDEGDNEARAWFPCPFCYVEIELPLLCVHLQDEHCFELKNAVCPICAANLGKDVLGHFTMQHANSIKRRKESKKSSFWNNVSSNMVKDFKELSSFLGANLSTQGSVNEPSPDPLLLPFLCTVPVAVPNDNRDDSSSGVVATNDEHSSVNIVIQTKLKDRAMWKKQNELHSLGSFFCRLFSRILG
ncbi:hypothetical protein CASFOL_027946 [Castilleja foliolosa]|uniref:Di19 zinc-binding domain-containing protein n=1 Tax=Castilleja foliolosa TaxID=1961234 RepID=A0ABD3CJI9_9LAMI